MDRQGFEALARYNTWMNRKLLEAAATLADAERRRDDGRSFGAVPGSIHGLFNHLLLADRIWMGRFNGVDLAPGEIGPGGIRSLGQELHGEFDELARARVAMDAELEQWVGALTPERLVAPLDRGKGPAMPLWCSLLHVFNHQTHHRGQISALLAAAGVDYGVTDLVALLRSEVR